MSTILQQRTTHFLIKHGYSVKLKREKVLKVFIVLYNSELPTFVCVGSNTKGKETARLKQKKDYRMEDTKLHELEISENFLIHINELTKMSIKVYISLVYLKHKRGEYFKASHYEISINVFDDEDERCYPEWFGIRTDHGQYFKAFKQLETLGLIKRYQSKTKNGGNKVNRYRVY